jgi:predicted RNA binding protein YcfA (HicA-like mRNA interferase family)
LTRLPTITPRKLVAALKRAGFLEDHQRGSHLHLWHPQRRLMLTVPMHAGDLAKGTLRAILKQADLTEGQLLDLL